jgi:hypothetical protein
MEGSGEERFTFSAGELQEVLRNAGLPGETISNTIRELQRPTMARPSLGGSPIGRLGGGASPVADVNVACDSGC